MCRMPCLLLWSLPARPMCHAYYYSHFLLAPCLLVPWHALTAARASSNLQLITYYRANLPVHPRVDRVLHNPNPDPDPNPDPNPNPNPHPNQFILATTLYFMGFTCFRLIAVMPRVRATRHLVITPTLTASASSPSCQGCAPHVT